MGWASGSALAEEVWGLTRGFVPKTKRKMVARAIIEVFEKEDADDWDEDQLICQDAEYFEEDD